MLYISNREYYDDLSLRICVLKPDRLKIIEDSDGQSAIPEVMSSNCKDKCLKYWEAALDDGVDSTKSSLSFQASLFISFVR